VAGVGGDAPPWRCSVTVTHSHSLITQTHTRRHTHTHTHTHTHLYNPSQNVCQKPFTERKCYVVAFQSIQKYFCMKQNVVAFLIGEAEWARNKIPRAPFLCRKLVARLSPSLSVSLPLTMMSTYLSRLFKNAHIQKHQWNEREKNSLL